MSSSPFTRRCFTRNAQETHALGILLGKQAASGDYIVCDGPLGAGKTTFIQGFARGMEVPDNEYVRSPTFALLHQYNGRCPLYHFDFYRLTDATEVDNIGFMDDALLPGVTVIEWGNKFPTVLPAARLEIQFQILSPETRFIYCTAYGRAYLRYGGISWPCTNASMATS